MTYLQVSFMESTILTLIFRQNHSLLKSLVWNYKLLGKTWEKGLSEECTMLQSQICKSSQKTLDLIQISNYSKQLGFACKVARVEGTDIENEYWNLREINHEFIVKIYGAFIEETTNFIFLFMEKIEGFDFSKMI